MRRVCLPAFVICLVLVAADVQADGRNVVINEILASNTSTLADEDGDYEDWIELHNSGTSAIRLHGWGLSDDYENPYRWVFPDLTLGPGGFLLIWASGKDRRDPDAELHTNFSIAAAGEEVLLTDADGHRVDELAATEIPSDVSFGRRPDGTGDWYFFSTPTPAASNDTEGFQEILGPVVLSHTPGFYDAPFDLTLSHPDPGVTIYYTLDGSEPSPDDTAGSAFQYKNHYPAEAGDPLGEFLERPIRSHLYKGPVHVRDRTGDPDPISHMNTTRTPESVLPAEDPLRATVVRARAYRDGYLPSPLATASYFTRPGMSGRYHVPVVSISLPDSSLFGYESGIYVAGRIYDDWSRISSGTTFPPANFRRRGEQWERRANFEYFSPAGDRILGQEAGVRIHGGGTRYYPQKSLRLYARTRYGDPEFNHQFFDTKDTGTFRRFILRNSGNDRPRTMFRDALMHRLVQDLDLDQQAYQPVVVFINGEYWGIHNLRDRLDKYYLHYRFGVDPENLDILTRRNVATEGTSARYSTLLTLLRRDDLSDPEVYAGINTMMDVDNFTDYQVAQIYFANTDWPGNNVDYWRLRTTAYQPHAPRGHDGRFRWMMYDTDHGFGFVSSYRHNTIEHATASEGSAFSNPPWSTELLRGLLQNDSFRSSFINRMADYLNSIFHADTVGGIIDDMAENLAPLMPEHIERWRVPASVDDWHDEVEILRSFARNRARYVRSHFSEYFELGGTADVTVHRDDSEGGDVRINNLSVSAFEAPKWTGVYFMDIPLEIEAVPAQGYRFSHWEGLPEGTPAEAEIVLEGDVEIRPHFREITDTAILHYWHFNDLAGGTVDTVAADLSTVDAGWIVYPGTGAGYMDDAGGTTLNVRLEQSAGSGLRVRNPSDTRELIFRTPSTGYHDLEFSFAVHRTNSGAQWHELHYSPDGGESWVRVGDAYGIESEWHAASFDLSNINAVNDNPNIQLRLLFPGEAAAGAAGNNRFDNVALEGRSLHVSIDREDPPPGEENEPYGGYPFTGEGGTLPYGFDVTGGALPAGMTLSADGLLAGTPEEAGTFVFTVTVTDSGESADSHLFTLFVQDEPREIPSEFALHANHPNPFNPTTTIPFDLPEPARVTLAVYDVLGKRVAVLVEENLDPGSYRVPFDSSDLASGIYFYRIDAGAYREARRMVIVR